jgi:hypothetical protein
VLTIINNIFVYNSDYQVVVYYLCKSYIVPGRQSFERYLRADLHRLLGAELKASVELLLSYRLKTANKLKETKPKTEDACLVINRLECYSGFIYLQTGCQYTTRNSRDIYKHMPSVHHVKAAVHKRSALWTEYKLQMYFTAKGLIDYFVVVAGQKSELGRFTATSRDTPLTEGEKVYFKKIEEDFEKVKEEVAREASIVHDFEDSQALHVPWLERTGFLSYLKDLFDEEIYSSYKVPSDCELEGGSFDDPILTRIITSTQSLLNAAYELYSDTSPDWKMTY